MKKYYNGYVIYSSALSYRYSIGDDLCLAGESLTEEFKRPFYSLRDDDRVYLKQSLVSLRKSEYTNNSIRIEDPRSLEIIKKLKFPLSFNYNKLYESRVATLSIIYSIVEDIYGNKYAQELKTNLLFPLYSKETYDLDYYLSKYDLKYQKSYDNTYSLKAIPRVKSPFISLDETVVIEEGVASINDVENYKLDINSLKKLYKENAFEGQIVLTKDLDVSQTEEMVLMQDIEYILSRIKQISAVEEAKLRKELDSLLINYNNENSNVPISINSLREFKNKISFKLFFNRKNGVDRYLSEQYNTICHKLNDKYNKTISTQELDYLYEIFLKYSNELTLDEQNRILKLFTITYIAKIKEENLEAYQVEKTHFMELLKYASCELLISPDDLESLINRIKNKNEFHTLKLGK